MTRIASTLAALFLASAQPAGGATFLTDPAASGALYDEQPGLGRVQNIGFEELQVGDPVGNDYVDLGIEISGPSARIILPTAFGTSGVGSRVLVIGISSSQQPEVHLHFVEAQRAFLLRIVDAGPGLLADIWFEGALVETIALPALGEAVPGGVFLGMVFDGLADELHIRATGAGDGFGLDDLGFSVPGSVDNDGDGLAEEGGDCDDGDPSIFLGAWDGCDGLDNNCDGRRDDDVDDDGDGFSPCAGDCDDTDATLAPGQPEACDNGVDEDCDGVVDDDADLDGDGYSGCEGDCEDGDPNAVPGAAEACDGADNDCDGIVDEQPDADGDGFTFCEGDCDDGDPGRVPGPSCVPLPEVDPLDPAREDQALIVHPSGVGGGGCDCATGRSSPAVMLLPLVSALLGRRWRRC